ncbi:hypothetical protein DFJ74DRAFT_703446 [Hyaloraphidium curvatum]|nr:hypothetical protein DFJ74DRAFT_703446 [Hyaloraphidium curvatum]
MAVLAPLLLYGILAFVALALTAIALVFGFVALQAYYSTRPDLPTAIPADGSAKSRREATDKDIWDCIVWCEKALVILDEMGILKKLEDPASFASSLPPGIDLEAYKAAGFEPGKPLARRVRSGGFVSPSGIRCINDKDDSDAYGTTTPIRTYAIKRFVIDEWIAKTARSVGAELVEGCEVGEARLDKESGIWTVSEKKGTGAGANGTDPHHEVELETGDQGSAAAAAAGGRTFKGRLLVIADGSTSYLAQKLGLVKSQPDSVCSHSYYVPGEKGNAGEVETSADGVMLFSQSVLPGYSACFRHSSGDIYLGTYILPGGQARPRWIKPFEDTLVSENVYARSLYSGGKWRESKKLAPIRCYTGDRSERSYGDRVLVIGDAAGQVDPLTGEGIHTAMVAARLAAQTAAEMFSAGRFDEAATAVYERRWAAEMGPEFFYSRVMAWILYHFPWVLDCMATVGVRRKQEFLDHYGEAMTGQKSKIELLRWRDIVEIIPEMIRRLVTGQVASDVEVVPGYMDAGAKLEAMFSRKGR